MDLSQYKSLKVGGIELVRLVIGGVVAWAKQTYTNLVPLSTDTDGSIFNGTGYKDNVRLSSSGGLSSSAQNGSTTTGFIPFAKEDIIRLKGVEWLQAFTKYGGHYYITFYDSSKTRLTHLSSESYAGGSYDHVITVTRDSNGIEFIQLNQTYGSGNSFLNDARIASYIRITVRGKGADMILTINEEIT